MRSFLEIAKIDGHVGQVVSRARCFKRHCLGELRFYSQLYGIRVQVLRCGPLEENN